MPQTPFDLFGDSPQTIWHKSAPPAVRKAFRSGRPSKGWSAWTKHLAKRTEPEPLAELLPGRMPPLLWALPEATEDSGRAVQGTPDAPNGTNGTDGPSRSELAERLNEINRLTSEAGADDPSAEHAALAWLADVAGAAADASYAIESLAWCHALPGLAKLLAPEVWWDLLRHLLGTAADADGIRPDDDPLAHQLLAGELPLSLAYLFPEIAPCRKRARGARHALSAGLVDLLDGDGLPHARHLGLLRPLLACWTRCRAIGDELPKGCWSRRAQVQYECAVRHALRLSRADGAHVFSNGAGRWRCEDLFEAALRLGGDRDDAEIARLVLPRDGRANGKSTGKAPDRGRPLPDAADHSEWAAVGVLRSGWAAGDPCLVAAYPGDSVRLEFQCRGDVLWTGRWGLDVRRDGQPVHPASDWEDVCWVSDRDVDYLELEIRLEGGLRVQRHMLLAREDGFLLLADAVLGDRPARLEHRGRLPLANGIAFRPADETHEGYLVGRRRSALVLPLALPEWRTASHAGSLVETDEGLELRRHAEGRSVFAPLWFDLRPRRMRGPFTWRQLTVAENLAAQPDDVAVGYRVKVGKQQWLIYRSLAEPGNRTLLGHNLATEMLVARFGRDGEVEPLVEIE